MNRTSSPQKLMSLPSAIPSSLVPINHRPIRAQYKAPYQRPRRNMHTTRFFNLQPIARGPIKSRGPAAARGTFFPRAIGERRREDIIGAQQRIFCGEASESKCTRAASVYRLHDLGRERARARERQLAASTDNYARAAHQLAGIYSLARMYDLRREDR